LDSTDIDGSGDAAISIGADGTPDNGVKLISNDVSGFQADSAGIVLGAEGRMRRPMYSTR